MYMLIAQFYVFAIFLYSSTGSASSPPFFGTVISRDQDLHASYDYVIVGGGLSGLVVANRLSEDSQKTVLVIEAGPLITKDQEDEILIPGNYYSGIVEKYSWKLQSQPISGLKNRSFNINSAKVVGGGSAVNGMFYQRGSKEDYDSWERLGNKGWGWEGLLPYFKKTETFHPPDSAQAKEFGITYDPTAHGTSGPIQVSYPQYIYPQFRVIINALKAFGIKVVKDSSNGVAMGALWVPSSQDPKNQTRSYAKTGYYGSAEPRRNLHLIAERQVTKVLFNNKKQAIGVEYSSGINNKSFETIYANAEVVLAAGALHTPQILQLSGVGPKHLLKLYSIPIVEDLAGVGSNFQDHASIFTILNYSVFLGKFLDPFYIFQNKTYGTEKLTEYLKFRTGPYTVSVGNTANFLSLPQIAPNIYKSIINTSRQTSASTYLRPGTDATIIAGFEKQKNMLLNAFGTDKVAVDEFIVNGNINPIFALQKPLSRGFVEIASASPFAPPVVQPRTISDPIDIAILVECVRHARRFFANPAMALFRPVETNPGISVVSDDALAQAVAEATTPTFDHPSCTCPMMPRRFGGVVDAELRVYGVKGLRIVDASIMPIIPGAHLQSTVYAIAEKAADIMRGRGGVHDVQGK